MKVTVIGLTSKNDYAMRQTCTLQHAMLSNGQFLARLVWKDSVNAWRLGGTGGRDIGIGNRSLTVGDEIDIP